MSGGGTIVVSRKSGQLYKSEWLLSTGNTVESMSTLLQTGFESPGHRPLVLSRASASAALGIPHEVRLKLAKRMRDEQLRRYYEKEGRLQQEKEEDGAAADYDGSDAESRGDKRNREKKRTRMVAFQEKEMLLDAVQNGDTSEGIA